VIGVHLDAAVGGLERLVLDLLRERVLLNARGVKKEGAHRRGADIEADNVHGRQIPV